MIEVRLIESPNSVLPPHQAERKGPPWGRLLGSGIPHPRGLNILLREGDCRCTLSNHDHRKGRSEAQGRAVLVK